MNIYGIYEDDEYQECVFVGNIHEIAKEFRMSERSVRSTICRKRKIQGKKGKRYLIYRLYKEG